MTLEQALSSGFESLGLPLSPEAMERYRVYYDYLTEMNSVMNLTSIEGEEDSARLHFLDCAYLLTLPEFQGETLIDVGTGAGFPGLALKIARPEIKLTLLDSLDKRVTFLKNTCAKLGFEDVSCLHLRAEEAPAEMREAFDIASSRAVARMNILCELCLPFVKTGGVFIAMKGGDCEGEVHEAKRGIEMLGGRIERVERYTVPGTDAVHSAIIIRKESGTPRRYPRRWAQIKKQAL